MNSAGDDVFFMMTPKFNRAYYSSNKEGGYGKMDLYRLTFSEERQLFAEIKGFVMRGKDQIPCYSKISILDKITGEELSVHYSDSVTGEYLLLLPHGITYDLRVEAEGFVAYQEEYKIPSQISYYQFYQEVKHFHITDKNGNVIGQKVILENTFSNSEDTLEGTTVGLIDAIAYSDSLEKMSNDRDEPYSDFASSLVHAENELGFSKMADMKFYMSQDSFVSLLKEDTTIYKDIREIMLSSKILEDKKVRPYHKFISGMIEQDLTTMAHLIELSERIDVPLDSLISDMRREQMLDPEALKDYNVKFFDNEVDHGSIDDIAAYVEPDMLEIEHDEFRFQSLKLLQGKFIGNLIMPDNGIIRGVINLNKLPADYNGGMKVYLISDQGDTLVYTLADMEGVFEFNRLSNNVNYIMAFDYMDMNADINGNTDTTAVQRRAKLLRKDDLATRVNRTLINAKKIQEDIAKLIEENQDGVEVVPPSPSTIDKSKDVVKKELSQGELITTFYFDFNHHHMKSVNCVLIEDFYRSYKDRVDIKFNIIGHADSEGPEDYNLILSERRAKWIAKYFEGLGLELSKVNVDWKGETQLAVPDHNSKGQRLRLKKKKNRRVEIRAIVQ